MASESHPEKHILVVDDDADILMALSLVLRGAGYRIVTASNGAEALDKLRGGGELPFIILTDLMMPVMNGWDFVAALRTEPALINIPVVVMTGFRDVADHAALQTVVCILDKPLDLEELVTTIAAFS